MDTIGSHVARLRGEAGWPRRLDAYDATVRLTAEGKIPEPVTPDEWSRIERPSGPKGPQLATLWRVSAALSAGLGRRVTLDELVTGSRYVPAPTTEPDTAILGELDRGNAASRRRRRGTRRPNGEKRRES